MCDYGSGFGDLINALISALSENRLGLAKAWVDLIDSDRGLLSYAAQELLASGHRVSTFAPSDFSPVRRSYDFVVASHVLYYVSDRPALVQQFAHMLARNGLLAITARAASCDTFRIRSAVRAAPHVVPPEPGRPRLYVADVEAMVRNAGLACATHTITMGVRFPVRDVCWEDLYEGRPCNDVTEFVRFVGHIPSEQPARQAAVEAVEGELSTRRAGESYVIRIGTAVVTGRTRQQAHAIS
jgi:SAM-dependent methyltransferase